MFVCLNPFSRNLVARSKKGPLSNNVMLCSCENPIVRDESPVCRRWFANGECFLFHFFHATDEKADRGEPGLEGAPREHHGRPQQGGESTKLKFAGFAGVGPPKPPYPILRTPSHLPSHQRHPTIESSARFGIGEGRGGRGFTKGRILAELHVGAGFPGRASSTGHDGRRTRCTKGRKREERERERIVAADLGDVRGPLSQKPLPTSSRLQPNYPLTRARCDLTQPDLGQCVGSDILFLATLGNGRCQKFRPQREAKYTHPPTVLHKGSPAATVRGEGFVKPGASQGVPFPMVCKAFTRASPPAIKGFPRASSPARKASPEHRLRPSRASPARGFPPSSPPPGPQGAPQHRPPKGITSGLEENRTVSGGTSSLWGGTSRGLGGSPSCCGGGGGGEPQVSSGGPIVAET